MFKKKKDKGPASWKFGNPTGTLSDILSGTVQKALLDSQVEIRAALQKGVIDNFEEYMKGMTVQIVENGDLVFQVDGWKVLYQVNLQELFRHNAKQHEDDPGMYHKYMDVLHAMDKITKGHKINALLSGGEE